MTSTDDIQIAEPRREPLGYVVVTYDPHAKKPFVGFMLPTREDATAHKAGMSADAGERHVIAEVLATEEGRPVTETKRIRWDAGTEAELTAWFGYAGTLDTFLFQILRPISHLDEWALTSRFPGAEQGGIFGANPDELKAEAERWLSEFVSSLGGTP